MWTAPSLRHLGKGGHWTWWTRGLIASYLSPLALTHLARAVLPLLPLLHGTGKNDVAIRMQSFGRQFARGELRTSTRDKVKAPDQYHVRPNSKMGQ